MGEEEINYTVIECSTEKPSEDEYGNEGVWRMANDNRLPDSYSKPSKVRDMVNDYLIKMSSAAKLKAETILAHECKELQDSYKSVAKTIVDGYNKAHTLKVFGEEE